MLRSAKLLLICVPLVAVAACSSPPDNTAALQSQIAAANQKAEQAMATAQQALQQAQQASAQGSAQYQRSLQK